MPCRQIWLLWTCRCHCWWLAYLLSCYGCRMRLRLIVLSSERKTIKSDTKMIILTATSKYLLKICSAIIYYCTTLLMVKWRRKNQLVFFCNSGNEFVLQQCLVRVRCHRTKFYTTDFIFMNDNYQIILLGNIQDTIIIINYKYPKIFRVQNI